MDAKAPELVHRTVPSLANCYNTRFGNPNGKHNPIIVVEHPVGVVWGHISVLEADIKCMQELNARKNRLGDF